MIAGLLRMLPRQQWEPVLSSWLLGLPNLGVQATTQATTLKDQQQ